MKSKVFEKYNKPCAMCGTLEMLTRHHVKNELGYKTGQIQILCRPCHDEIEEYYRLNGMLYIPICKKKNVYPKKPKKIDISSCVPFYATNFQTR